MRLLRNTPWYGYLLILAAFLTGLAVAAFLASNNQRTNDIQRSRVESCELTYEGIRQVFRPFFRPKDQRTPKEQRDIRKFNRRIDALKASCPEQVTS